MARIKRKGTTGQAKNFITRSQAIRKLQVSLPDFRRMCIFKGIYPREPRNKKKASKSSTPSTTFYYSKDIQYLLHEPLLEKFREHKALSKKIARSLGKNEIGDAVRLEKSGKGKITLDHVIKERYPTFVDALRDLDDALSMLFLFANLPANSTAPAKTIALCQRLCHEFQHYVIVTHSLRKSFLSIKGIYYQATIQGQDVMWLVPYRFVQRVTADVDFRIMGTFVEFYTTLLGFVNFRLYTTIGLVYPPRFDSTSDEQGGELGAFKLEGRGFGIESSVQPAKPLLELEGSTGPREDIQSKVDAITARAADAPEDELVQQADRDDNSNEKIDSFEPTGEGADILPQPQISNFEAASLFAPFTFFLSRETPRQPLEFILRAFGCKRIGWDAVLGDGAFTNNEADPAITYQIVDRPALTTIHYDIDETEQTDSTRIPAGHRVPGRTYVQPQWVWDCINNGKLLRPDFYTPGATLPPHLSPWVKPRRGAYDPSAPLEAQEREGEAEEFEEEEAEAAAVAVADEGSEREGGNEDSDAENELIDANGHAAAGDARLSVSEEEGSEDKDGFATFGEESDPAATLHRPEAESDIHQAELEAEAAGLPFSANVSADAGTNGHALRGILKGPGGDDARRKAARRKQEEDDELQRRLGMMSRKKRQQMEKMLQSKNKEEAEAEALRKKRRRLEKRDETASVQ